MNSGAVTIRQAVTKADRKAFVDATRSVYAKWSAGPSGDFVKRVLQQVQ